MDKHYLADLETRGIPIVPSRFIERGTELNLRAFLESTGWSEAVIKPCVSGGARFTYRVNRARTPRRSKPRSRPILANEAFLLQPFVPAIMTAGEDSLMVFGGALLARGFARSPSPGTFACKTIMAARPTRTTQRRRRSNWPSARSRRVRRGQRMGRVDLVQDATGQWQLMELELIEPELWLRYHPPSAIKFAPRDRRVALAAKD
jgi:hypothetical protein